MTLLSPGFELSLIRDLSCQHWHCRLSLLLLVWSLHPFVPSPEPVWCGLLSRWFVEHTVAIICEIGQCLNLHQLGEEARRRRTEGQCSPERRVEKEKPAKDITELWEELQKWVWECVDVDAPHGTIKCLHSQKILSSTKFVYCVCLQLTFIILQYSLLLWKATKKGVSGEKQDRGNTVCLLKDRQNEVP